MKKYFKVQAFWEGSMELDDDDEYDCSPSEELLEDDDFILKYIDDHLKNDYSVMTIKASIVDEHGAEIAVKDIT